MAIKTSAGGGSLIHDRDILFYDRLGRLIDSQGRHFVYSVMKSVELEEYPANQHNIERGEVLLCYLFRQFQEELVGCFAIGTSIMGGTLPQSIVHHITIERMLVVQNLPLVARAKAYSARIAKSTGRFPSTTNSCDVCMKKPRKLSSSLKICMGCRRNTCRKCREWCTVFRLDIRTQKPGKERFCTQCISDVTQPTMSAFYMCSLKESTNSSTHNEDSSSTSISSGAKGSSSPSSSRSHKNLDSDPNAWLPPPSDLDNFANFVERASLSNLSDMQWNQEELDYYIDILQEVGHVNVSEFTEQNNCENYGWMQGDKHDFDPSSHYKDGRKMSRDPNQQFFSVDDLD
ncbi:unnamed protein product [Peronospora destructor]|uniref:FYVE-type domain-containing protein n=1 Tax=Peronospora destructor TaxID=86335 RepID=A0AAV0VAS3_9STRA|nr:unnamed protein product [Peronospora destructor]